MRQINGGCAEDNGDPGNYDDGGDPIAMIAAILRVMIGDSVHHHHHGQCQLPRLSLPSSPDSSKLGLALREISHKARGIRLKRVLGARRLFCAFWGCLAAFLTVPG